MNENEAYPFDDFHALQKILVMINLSALKVHLIACFKKHIAKSRHLKSKRHFTWNSSIAGNKNMCYL